MKIGKCKKLVCNLYDKKNYVVHIRSLKQALNHGLILKQVHRVIQFNQKAGLKPYIDMNTEKREETKNDFEKDFFKLMNNAVFGKTMENVRKHRDIKLVTTDKRRNRLVSEPNYHTTKWFSEKLLAIDMKKTKVKMNKPINLGLSILEISKILMYKFRYDYLKPKCDDNMKLCYMYTDSFIMCIKTEDFYKDIANDVEKRFDTSNYEVNRPLPTGKNKKKIGLMKDELGGKIMTEFVALRPKTFSYLTDDCEEDKKAKGTKKCENKIEHKIEIDIDKIYLYARYPYEAKYQDLINKREKVGLDHFKDPKAFMEYSNDMEDVCKNIENYNPGKKCKILIVFDDMIADMINNKKLNPTKIDMFIRGRKLNISIVFITQSYFKVPKDVRLNSTNFLS